VEVQTSHETQITMKKPFSETRLGSLFSKPVVVGLAEKAVDLLSDKVRDADASVIKDAVNKRGKLSSKRILNVGGTGTILTIASVLIYQDGLTKENLILVGIGAAYSLIMTYLTILKEKK